MNLDIASRLNAQFMRSLAVCSVWIRNVKRAVKLTMRVLRVHDVKAFGNFVVSLPFFRPSWDSAQSYAIRFENFAIMQQGHFSLGLANLNAVSYFGGCRALGTILGCDRNKKN